jgi:glucosamine-6-phosphate deaminase
MDVVIVGDRESLGRLAASLVLEGLAADPRLVLGVATGSSPITTYRALVRARKEGTDFSQVTCVALDEYVRLPASDPRSYQAYVRREIAEPLGVRPSNVLVPDGNAADTTMACAAFEGAIRNLGGVDIQLLGIGRNGHLGFNEPGSAFASRTRLSRLGATTRADNARFFPRPEDVPTHCLTQGLGTIFDASKIVLLAIGPHKAAAVSAAVEGPVTVACPASILQLHSDVTVVVDKDAADGLSGSIVATTLATCSTSLGSSGTFLPVEGAPPHVLSHLRQGATLVRRDRGSRSRELGPRDPRWRVHGARRTIWMWEVHDAADAGRFGGR